MKGKRHTQPKNNFQQSRTTLDSDKELWVKAAFVPTRECCAVPGEHGCRSRVHSSFHSGPVKLEVQPVRHNISP